MYEEKGSGSIEENEPTKRHKIFYFESVEDDKDKSEKIDGELCKKESIEPEIFTRVYLFVIGGSKLMKIIMNAIDCYWRIEFQTNVGQERYPPNNYYHQLLSSHFQLFFIRYLFRVIN